MEYTLPLPTLMLLAKVRPTHNPGLQFIKPGYTGNALDAKGLYVNLDGPSERGLSDVLKWQSSRKELKHLKKKQVSNIEVKKDGDFLDCRLDGFTWLGHCSYYFTLNETNIITDPVLAKVSNIMPRYTDFPVPAERLNNIDLILISHNHRDHLDKKSMVTICQQNPNAQIYTGLEIGKLIRQWKIKNKVVEAGWYQQFPEINKLKFYYLPAKHWNRRALRDTNEMLWGSFMLSHNDQNLYFGADSGYGMHFKAIANLFPHIHYAFIGIGAYKPEWFMHTSHTSPGDALRVMSDLNASQLVPTHHGTFDLADEPIDYPKKELQQLLEENQELTDKVQFLAIGKKHYLNNKQ